MAHVRYFHSSEYDINGLSQLNSQSQLSIFDFPGSGTCDLIPVNLPPLPVPRGSCDFAIPPQLIYNPRFETLYAMNSGVATTNEIHDFEDFPSKLSDLYSKFTQSVLALRFNGNHKGNKHRNTKFIKTSDKLEWTLENSTLLSRHSTSLCLVDQQKFIGIFGGSDSVGISNAAELYAPNCKLSIRLKDMKQKRNDAVSVYDGMGKHRVYVAGPWWIHGMEQYDINQDRWEMVLDNLPFSDLKHLILSDDNPNIMFLIGLNRDKQYELHSVDLRGKCTEKMIVDLLPSEVWLNNPKIGGLPNRPARHTTLNEYSCVLRIGP